MTAPNYPDKHEVNTLSLNQIKNMVTSEAYDPITVLAIAAISLWGARDEARTTAEIQDAAIQKAQARMFKLEKILRAARESCEGCRDGLEIEETHGRGFSVSWTHKTGPHDRFECSNPKAVMEAVQACQEAAK